MKTDKSIIRYLFEPFRYIAGGKSLAWGIATLLLLTFLAFSSHTYFDGVLDIHLGDIKASSNLFSHTVCIFVSWITAVIIFYLTACILSGFSIRPVDMAGTLALAQAPRIFVALLCFIPVLHITPDANTLKTIDSMLLFIQENLFLIVINVFILTFFVIWLVVLMYNAYSVSGNVKGVKGVVSFIIALLIAEIISKILLFLILH